MIFQAIIIADKDDNSWTGVRGATIWLDSERTKESDESYYVPIIPANESLIDELVSKGEWDYARTAYEKGNILIYKHFVSPIEMKIANETYAKNLLKKL